MHPCTIWHIIHQVYEEGALFNPVACPLKTPLYYPAPPPLSPSSYGFYFPLECSSSDSSSNGAGSIKMVVVRLKFACVSFITAMYGAGSYYGLLEETSRKATLLPCVVDTTTGTL